MILLTSISQHPISVHGIHEVTRGRYQSAGLKNLWRIAVSAYGCQVSRRLKGDKSSVVSKDAVRILLLATAIAGVPILGTIFVTSATTEPDLAELVPINSRLANYVVLNWSELMRDPSAGIQKATLRIADNEVQALGYMFDGDRPSSKGEWVREFVLLPEAGTLIHPAHRIRDQLITVHLEDSKGVRFSPRLLIWVWGKFRVSPEPAVRSRPLYTVEQARVKLADKADIPRYFR